MSFPYPCGAKPSPIDERDYKVSDLFPIAGAVKFPTSFITESLPDFVLDQGDSNMCVACSLTYLRYIQEISQSKNSTPFSPCYIYGNRDEDMYHGEGMYPREALSTLKDYGVCHFNDLAGYYTYEEAAAIYNKSKTITDELAHPYRIDSYYSCNSKTDIKTAIMKLGAVSAMFPVYDELYYPDSDGIVSYTSKTTKGTLYGYHQMTIVGWTENSQWIVLNSWGNAYGKNGYCYIPYDYPIEESWATIDNILEVFNMTFTDVDDSHWAKESIEKAVNKGVINGYDENTFGPDDALTRAQMVVILDRLGLLD